MRESVTIEADLSSVAAVVRAALEDADARRRLADFVKRHGLRPRPHRRSRRTLGRRPENWSEKLSRWGLTIVVQ